MKSLASVNQSQNNEKAKKVLIVGAGGIGCELIKNFAKPSHLTSYQYQITLIDFDTIAETNLNRQFCFRKENIGQAKVEVLEKYFKSLNPFLNLVVYN